MSIEIELLKKRILIITKLIELYQILLRKLFNSSVDVIIHHTATNRDYTRFESIDNAHKRRGYSMSSLGFYCAYNCLITADGVEHWARNLDEKGEGTSAYKGFHIDLCLTGN